MRKDKQLRPDMDDPGRSFSFGAAMVINTQRGQDSNFQNYLNEIIEETKTTQKYDHLDFNELATLTAELTKQKILQSGGDKYDLDTVGWEMGVLCYVWRNSLEVCNKEFDKIFIASWENYFTVKSNLDFTFKSSDHIRYENGIQVAGPHGEAPRVIKVEHKNDETYIVTIYNMQGNHPLWQNNVQMAPKQMKIINNSQSEIKLRGYGHDDYGASFSNYGITISLINEEIEKITLHIINRHIDIEYLK